MKKDFLLTIIFCLLLLSNKVYSQEVKYTTYIYTSNTLADEIQDANNNQDDTRRFDADLFGATLNAAKGIGAGYVSTFIDLGVNALGNLLTRKSRMEKEWIETVSAENKWSTHISTVQDIKDFYRKPSTAGALDPLNMTFNGIGCLRVQDQDTVFFISCHIDRSKLNRIVNHSKFELTLDTLIISPYHSNLPNTKLPLEFSFDQRQNFNLLVTMNLTASWFTDAIELHTNEHLGEFRLSVSISKEDLDENGFLRYIREEDMPSKYTIVGDSFIIPRSYMGYRDSNGKYKNIWGTGQYKLDIDISETCGISPSYRAEWSNDLKRRNNMKPKENFFTTVMETITSQHWDDITKTWVITTLSAPAGVLSKEIINKTGLSSLSQGQGTEVKQQSNIPKTQKK